MEVDIGNSSPLGLAGNIKLEQFYTASSSFDHISSFNDYLHISFSFIFSARLKSGVALLCVVYKDSNSHLYVNSIYDYLPTYKHSQND